MFGYIRVLEGELKIKDFGLYRGVYCGLCKTMNRRTGKLSPLTLTYDFVLLALLRSGISGEGFTVRKGKCIAHPIKKRPIAHENDALRFCSAVSAVLTYYKLLDDKNDGDAKKQIVVGLTLGQAKRNLKKAVKAFPEYRLDELSEKVGTLLSELSALEAEKCPSCDRLADVFGRLLGVCFSHCIEDEGAASALSELGLHIGRWIYIIDLADDFAKDKKKGSFNPLIEAGYTELPEMMLRATLARLTEMAYKALQALDIKYIDIKRVLENIICFGMPEAVNKILKKHSEATPLLTEPKEN